MGSFAGAVAAPMLATYAGSKAFLSTYTTALAEEAKPYNIVVEHVNAFYVVSLFRLRLPLPSPTQTLSTRSLTCPNSVNPPRSFPSQKPTFTLFYPKSA